MFFLPLQLVKTHFLYYFIVKTVIVQILILIALNVKRILYRIELLRQQLRSAFAMIDIMMMAIQIALPVILVGKKKK